SIPPAVQGGRWRAVAAPGSTAETAGLRTGDELVRINGRAILDGTDVTAAVRAVGPGARVVVDVVRDGRPVTIRFSAGAYHRVRGGRQHHLQDLRHYDRRIQDRGRRAHRPQRPRHGPGAAQPAARDAD